MDIKSADGLTLVQFIRAADDDLSNVRQSNGEKSMIADLQTFICAIVLKYINLDDYKIINKKNEK
jgi:hypothetical protein